MSFLEIAAESNFPIQNLPYGIFNTVDDSANRIGVAIGEYVLDLSKVSHLFNGPVMRDKQIALQKSTLNALMSLGRKAWQETRATLQKILSKECPVLRDDTNLKSKALIAMS